MPKPLYICYMNAVQIQNLARPVLEHASIKKAYLFGSAARGENTPKSDLDILVELNPLKPMGLIEFIKLQMTLEGVFQTKVDLVSTDGLSPHIAPFIHRDKILIYEA